MVKNRCSAIYILAGSLFLAMTMLHGLSASAQQVAPMDFVSVGRGAPLSPAIPGSTRTNPEQLEAYPPAEISGYPEQYWMVGPFRDGEIGVDGAGRE